MFELVFSHKLFNPLFWHIRKAMHDDHIRYIFNRGGSSSGKSVSTTQAVLLSVFGGEGSSLIIRKVGTSVKNTVYEEFKTQIKALHLSQFFDLKENCIMCSSNGLKIDFTGLDDPEKIKSITGYRWIVLEEATEFEYEDFTQIRFRLRGKPGLQIICNFNPISEDSWIKTKILDTYEWNDLPCDLYGKVKDPVTKKILPKSYSKILGKRTNKAKMVANERTGKLEKYAPDTLEIHSSYKNNFWVVGSPDGKYGYYDRQTITNYQWYKDHDYNYYRIYALGEWGSIKTGGEFLHAFDSNRHIKTTGYIKGLPVHISIDNNVLPYISVAFYQVSGSMVRQFHEICAEDPYNTVTQASCLAVNYLQLIKYKDVVFLYGDASTRSGNTIDDDKRSFLDKFTEGLESVYHVQERIPDSNPSVPMSGEFVNYMLNGGSGMSFVVDDSCKYSVVDYNNAKKDVNGGILKTRVKDKLTQQSYEKYGHLTDCLRYLVTQVFKEEYIRFSLKRKRSKLKQENDDMKYFDYSKDYAGGDRLAYVFPDNNGKFILLMCRIHKTINIDDVIYTKSFDEAVLCSRLEDYKPKNIVFEGDRNYFMAARNLRENYDVRIMHRAANPAARICANEDFVKNKVRFRSDYDELEQYSDFMNGLMDYSGDNKGEEYEAMDSIAALCSYAAKKYFIE